VPAVTRVVFTGQDCRLRLWSEDDAGSLIHNANHRSVWRNLGDIFPHPYTLDDARAWFDHVREPGRDLHFAIEHAGAAVGGIGVTAGLDIARQTGRIGYWLGPDHWGRGIATCAVRALVDHVQAQRLFARLEAAVFAWNPASMRVLEKAGFEREGVLRKSVSKDGQLVDSVLYAVVLAVANP